MAMQGRSTLRGHRVVGLGGYAECGKDAVAGILQHAGWKRTYMSRPLEKALLVLDPWCEITKAEADAMFGEGQVRVVGEGSIWRYSDLHTAVGYDLSKKCKDVREYLQKLGTEVGRNMFADDVWVRIGFKKIDKWLQHGHCAAITGIRFLNEMDALHERKGIAVWVNRPGYEPVNAHSSDNTLGPKDFDLIVDNDGTLHDLQKKVLTLTVPWN